MDDDELDEDVDDDFGQSDDGADDEDDESDEEMHDDDDNDYDGDKDVSSSGSEKNRLMSTNEEIKVEEQMQIALEVDNLNIPPALDDSLLGNLSHDAENGDHFESSQTQEIDLNKEIVGDKLSYDELFKKHKKRGRSDRNSMADFSKGMGDLPLIDGN